MFAKLSVVILTFAATACALLALRHSTIAVANELASAQLRIQRHDQDLWAVRSQIAELVTPEHVGTMVADVAKFHPLILPGETPGGAPTLNADSGEWIVAENSPKPKGSKSTGPTGPQ
ncbi:MAG: hypothetical protein AABZ53_07675 [Planctomycetota bacterium]